MASQDGILLFVKPGVLERSREANLSVNTEALSAWLIPYNIVRDLLFPELYFYDLVQLRLRWDEEVYLASDPRMEPLLRLMERIEPYFGFAHQDNSVYPVGAHLEKRGEDALKQFHGNFRREPWTRYNRTMVFGPELVEKFRIEKLSNAPTFQNVRLAGPTLMLWGPCGPSDVFPPGEPDYRNYTTQGPWEWAGEWSPACSQDYEARNHFLSLYDASVRSYLDLKPRVSLWS